MHWSAYASTFLSSLSSAKTTPLSYRLLPDLAWIHDIVRIEELLYALHHVHHHRVGHFVEEFLLFQAYPMLAGENAPELDGRLDDLFHGFHGPLVVLLVAYIREDRRVEIAVTRVAENHDVDVIFLRKLLAFADEIGHPGSRHGHVLREDRFR